MLHRQSEKTTEYDDREEQPQQLLQQSAEPEAAVKQDQRDTQRAEPQVAAQPELSTADSPERHLFATGKEASKEHHQRADDAVQKAHQAAARRTFR